MTFSLAGCGEKSPPPVEPPRPVRFILAPAPVSGVSLSQTGEIHAHDQITLGFRLDGRITSRTVDVGARVYAGQSLATIESESSHNQLLSAQADVESAAAAEHLAALSLKRMTLLMPQGAIARVQLDSAKSDWQSAAARLKSSQATLSNAKNTLSWTTLTAPEDGIITSVSASAGQVVSEGQTVVTLATSGSRDAVFDVADPQLFNANASTPFLITLLANPAVQVSGSLRDVSPQADAQTRTWRIRVTLNNPPEAIALGASVLGQITLPGQSAIRLPAPALTRSQHAAAVFVVDRKTQTVHLRPVVVDRFTVDAVWVKSGIEPGEAVVTAGVSHLRDGEKVSAGEPNP